MSMSDAELREGMHAYLRRNHPEVCRHWFDTITVLSMDGGVLRLLVDEPIRLNYLQRTCVVPFTEAAQAVSGRLLAVKFIGPDGAGAEPEARPSAPATATEASPLLDEQMLLSPDYTFDSFVVGPGNRLAINRRSACHCHGSRCEVDSDLLHSRQRGDFLCDGIDAVFAGHPGDDVVDSGHVRSFGSSRGGSSRSGSGGVRGCQPKRPEM